MDCFNSQPGRFISFLAGCVLIAFPTTGQAVTLVEKGRPRAIIVLPTNPSASARSSARLLQEHIRQISSAELPIRTEDKAADSPTRTEAWILVGEGQLTEKFRLSSKGLGPGGIHLSAKGQAVALFGPDAKTPSDPDGTRHAVITFLEEKLGVRYLWPGELGKVVPNRETIIVDDFEYRFTPKLAQRRIRSMGYHDRMQIGLNNLGFTKEEYERGSADARRTKSETPDWFAWQRLGGTLNINGGHAFTQLWARYGKDHPDWFALQLDGTRDQSKNPDRARLCVSNLELIEAIAHEKIAELKKNPALIGVSIAPNDGGRPGFCTCPKCEALDAANGRKVMLWDFTKGTRRDYEHVALTDRMVAFWNAIAEKVAKEYPDKLLVVDAYSVYAAPPVERKLHPNLVVRFAPLGYGSEEYRKESLRDWGGWSKAAKRIYFRPNLMLLGRRDGLPLIYVHKFGEDFRYLAAHGMMGTDFDSCCHNWSTQGLNYYVVARLHWNPEQDVDAVVEDYCKSGFGPAAKSIRRYFDRLEQLMNDVAAKQKKPVSAFDTKSLAALRKELEEARKEAGNDTAVRKRIEFLELGLRWAEAEARAHGFLADPATAARAEAKKALDERYALMREIFQKTPLALNVAYISWGEDGLWSRLGWQRPPKP